MNGNTYCPLMLFLQLALSTAAFAQSKPDWHLIANRDIDAVHRIIRDNHPGTVDSQNPHFSVWLEEGRAAALEQAKDARSRADYKRTLRRYLNGFQDGHLFVGFKEPAAQSWPGFLTRSLGDGQTVVTISEEPSVPVGTDVLACDHQSVSGLLDKFVRPYRSNAAIPHESQLTDSHLFIVDADDRQSLFRQCTIVAASARRTINLRWRPFEDASYDARLAAAQQRVLPEIGLREVDGVSMISLPSFNWWGDDARTMQSLVDSLTAEASTLHRAQHVVLDLRGNPGGNSEWGGKVARALWGVPAVEAIEGSFDWTVEWRASPENARLTRAAADQAAAAGLDADAAQRRAISKRMDAAIAAGESLVREHAPPTRSGLPEGYRSPFAHRVFVLTDQICASACLDFVDLVTRLPGVVHVGLPTSADAVYIDNVAVTLPSGLVDLSYSLKVYRNRTRKHNEWLTPVNMWPGGNMTDGAIAAWIRTL